MFRFIAIALLSLGVLSLSRSDSQSAAPPEKIHAGPPAVISLLEDNAEALLRQLTNPTGDPGTGHVEKTIVYSGTEAVKIVPMQRFHPMIPGWKHRIAKNPKPGEFRYLRFAWKSDGCAGVMVQLHSTDWHIRYRAGVDLYNWGSKSVAPTPSEKWVVVTCDLFKDFGEHTITGIAFTAFNGKACYFDHVYLGRTIDDLDRIDTTGFSRGKPVPPSAKDLDHLWQDLASDEAEKAYRSFWRLKANSNEAVPYLLRRLSHATTAEMKAKIEKWIKDLDDDAYRVREAASKALGEHLQEASPFLERTLRNPPSTEVRVRVRRLLNLVVDNKATLERNQRAIRVLEFTATKEAKLALESLAKQARTLQTSTAATEALKRWKP